MGTNHLHPLLSGARQVFLSHSALLSILTFHRVFGKLGLRTGTPLNRDTSRGRPAYPKLPGVRPTMGLLGGCGTGARGSTIPVILWVVRVRCGFLALCLLNGGMVLHLLRHIRLSLPVTVIRCGGYSLRILQRRNVAPAAHQATAQLPAPPAEAAPALCPDPLQGAARSARSQRALGN